MTPRTTKKKVRKLLIPEKKKDCRKGKVTVYYNIPAVNNIYSLKRHYYMMF